MTPWAMPEGIGSAVGWRYPYHSSAGGTVGVSRSSHADIHTFQEKRWKSYVTKIMMMSFQLPLSEPMQSGARAERYFGSPHPVTGT